MKRAVLVGVAALALVACSDPGPGKVHPYDRAPVPAVPDRTHLVTSSGTIADGQYWAVLSEEDRSGDDVLTFVLQYAEFGSDGSITVTEQPSRTVKGWPDWLVTLTVVASTRQNYAVPVDEVGRLASGAAPSAEAPEGYAYVDYPYLVTISSGQVVEAHQIWLETPRQASA